MADDITLTVRVRDLTRGEFDNIRRRMRGMGGEVRALARASDGATVSSDRFANSLTGLQRRLSQFQRTGNLARHEMDFMRRSMGLLGRDLRRAAADGELTGDQFRGLRDELERTRLDFDHLDNSLRRHDAIAQRNARNRAERQRQAERERREAQREAERRAREERRRQEADARAVVAIRQRLTRAHAAALREEARRQRQARQREEADFRRHASRMAAMGGDGGLNARFRGMSGRDLDRMGGSLSSLSNAVSGIDSGGARAVSRDLQAMSRVLGDARREGHLTRREFNALANGLTSLNHSARQLHRSGDLSRSVFRDMRNEIDTLRAHLRLLGDDGNVFTRMDSHLAVFQRRLRDTDRHGGRVRRTLFRMGDGAAGGLRTAVQGVGTLVGGFRQLTSHIKLSKRWTAILTAALVLMGPIAQALGALLTVALGGAFIALGAFALRGNAQVKAAFQDMKSTVGSTVREAASVLAGPLASAMDLIGEAVQKMGPDLEAAFAATAPLVEDFAGAFTDLAQSALPGLTEALRGMGPVMEGFRRAMSMIGQGIGDMFAAMTANGGGAALASVWATMGGEIQNLLVNIGEFINFAAKSESATFLMVGAFRALSGILHAVEFGLSILDGAFEAVKFSVDGLMDLISGGRGDLLRRELRDLLGVESPKGVLEEIKRGHEGAAEAARDQAAAIQSVIDKFQALNESSVSILDAQNAMEKAFDNAVKNAKALAPGDFKNGMFNLDTEKGQEAYDLVSQIAHRTSEYVNKLEEAKKPLSEINAAWKDGRREIIGLADEFGLTKEQMTQVADAVLAIPDKEIFIRAEKDQAVAGLMSVQEQIKKTPGAHRVVVDTLNDVAIAALKAVGLKTEQLPDGKTAVYTAEGEALSSIGAVWAALNGIDGKTANTYTRHHITYEYAVASGQVNNRTSKQMGRGASGGPISRLASGGNVQAFPGGGFVRGPGSSKSDSIFAMFPSGGQALISNTEYVVRAEAVKKYGVNFMDALNQGHLKLGGLARGGSVKGAAKGAKDEIRAATSGDTEKRLLKLMNAIVKGSMKMASALKSVSSELTKAKDRLRDLKSKRSSLSDSVKSGVLSASDITGGFSKDKPVTVQTIMAGLTRSRDKATAFADALKRLRKRGLNKQLLQQIAESGVEGGGLETAGALLTASGSELKSMGSLQSQISKAASSAGKTTADAVYAATIKAQEKLVKALDKLADALKKATKKKATGGIIGAASGGARGGLTLVGEQGPEVVRLPFGASVSSNPDTRRILGGGGGGSDGGVFVFPIYVGGKMLDEVILDSNRRTVRTRGGNVQVVFGGR
jgi:hypothetical protein